MKTIESDELYATFLQNLEAEFKEDCRQYKRLRLAQASLKRLARLLGILGDRKIH